MALGNISIRDTGGVQAVPVLTYQTELNTTAIYAGEPVKLKSAGSPYVIPLADGDPIKGTTTQVKGIAKSNSTQTSTADGTVDVYVPLPGVVYAAKAKTASTFDTLTEVNALANDRVVLDLTSSTYTVDVAAGDGATKGIEIVGGDYTTQTVYFKINQAVVDGPTA